jgi:adenylate cyclase
MARKEVNPQTQVRKKAPSAEEIRTELKRILESPDFDASQRSRDILSFVVEETLAKRSHTLKGFTIATQVFGRMNDFDPILDPIVRIEMGKLRRALEHYYLTKGKQNPIRIEIPKGTNVPTFHDRARMELGNKSGMEEAPEVSFEGSWPSVLVRPFQNLTGDPDKDYLGIGLATELASEISSFQEIRVLLYSLEGQGRRAADQGVRFTIQGNIREDRAGIKLAVNLMDTTSNKQIWSDTYSSDLETLQLIVFQEKIAQEIAVKTAGEHGVIVRALSQEAKNKPQCHLKSYEAVLRYYEFYQMHTPESFLRAKEALENAVRLEAECGQVWGLLGHIYANIYSLELPGFETALEKAREYAIRGVHLSPENQRCRAILAQVFMFSNEINAALTEANRALALNPNSLFLLDGIGYLLTLLGNWKRGPALIREVIQRNPYYSLYVHYALWVDWIRQDNYEQAHLEVMNFRRSSLFWEPLMQAATFGLLGRYEEGKQAVQKLLELKPDFPSRGRILIKHYIKFDDIVDRVIEGLSKIGLKVE